MAHLNTAMLYASRVPGHPGAIRVRACRFHPKKWLGARLNGQFWACAVIRKNTVLGFQSWSKSVHVFKIIPRIMTYIKNKELLLH